MLVLVLQTWQILVEKNGDAFEVLRELYGPRLRDILCDLDCLLPPFETRIAARQGLTLRHGESIALSVNTRLAHGPVTKSEG